MAVTHGHQAKLYPTVIRSVYNNCNQRLSDQSIAVRAILTPLSLPTYPGLRPYSYLCFISMVTDDYSSSLYCTLQKHRRGVFVDDGAYWWNFCTLHRSIGTCVVISDIKTQTFTAIRNLVEETYIK